MLRKLLAAAVLGSASLCFAQTGLVGKDQFPQFRGLSGLSGSGFAVGPDGRPDFRGAMGYSAPIGHTLGGFRLAVGGGVISGNTNRLSFFRSESLKNDATQGNGTGFALIGGDLGRYGRLAFGFTILSGVGDNVSHIQYSPPLQGPVQVGIGILDLGGSGGSSGEGLEGDDRTSLSSFGVVTGKVTEGVHASVGVGTRRFQKGFGSLSANFSPNFKALVEHDGFGWNYGVAYNPKAARAEDTWTVTDVRDIQFTMFLGMTKAKYPSWSLVVSF
jgi:hypothetical protein